MILLRDLGFSRNGEALVSGASLQLHPGWKVGLTGANGCGKSSFLGLLRGELHADRGDLERPPGWVMAHVAQDTPALPDAALDFVLDGDIELRQIERDLIAAEEHHDDHHAGEQIGLLHGRLGEIDGYAAPARAAALMHGLGFADEDFTRPVAEFSGGWRVRLNLARALMCRSDLLLLDEPTNHLDLDAIIWLEDWLKSYPGTLILISHDRDFLDVITSHILAIEAGKMQLFTGNYSACERARAERLANDMALAAKQRREAAHLQSYIDRFRAKASKARQAQSRIKMLAKMGDIMAAHIDTPFSFSFPEPTGFSDPLLVVDDAKVGYDKTAPIFDRLRFTLRPDSRIGLLGRNGAGKSTLMKLLAGELAPLAGVREEGRNLKLGYFAQHQLEQLRPAESPLWHMIKLEPRTREQDLRGYLGGFDFRGDMVDAPCGRFSGGEKSRLALALMIRTAPNLLLLDEPTNHLDLEMREALTIALQETEAGMVLVSHDRHLLRATCDELWLVANGKVTPFDGDLDDYAEWLNQSRAEEKSAEREKGQRRKESAADEERKKSALARSACPDARFAGGQRRPLQKESEKLEQQLAGWQGELKLLETRLADLSLYSSADTRLLDDLTLRQSLLVQNIEAAESRWLEIHELLEHDQEN
jgi:ATP-binding cassette subfamily F protein 3